MGLRFRKSLKLNKNAKVNINAKSVGLSLGSKGAHYSVNSKGNQTVTVGIPGTGLSYSKTLGKKTFKNKKKLLGFLAVLAVVVVVFIISKVAESKGTDTQGLINNALNPTSAAQTVATTVLTDDSTVYVTPSGKKYHTSKDCAGKNGNPITRKEAVEKGYSPCSNCCK